MIRQLQALSKNNLHGAVRVTHAVLPTLRGYLNGRELGFRDEFADLIQTKAFKHPGPFWRAFLLSSSGFRGILPLFLRELSFRPKLPKIKVLIVQVFSNYAEATLAV